MSFRVVWKELDGEMADHVGLSKVAALVVPKKGSQTSSVESIGARRCCRLWVGVAPRIMQCSRVHVSNVRPRYRSSQRA